MQALSYLAILDPPLKIKQNRLNISLWRAGQVDSQMYPYVFGLIIAAFILGLPKHTALTKPISTLCQLYNMPHI